MKNASNPKRKNNVPDELKPNYDLDYSKAKPNRFANLSGDARSITDQSHKVTIHKSDDTTLVKHLTPNDHAIVLDPDVREYFPDAEAVNEALRGLIALLPRKRRSSARVRS